MGLFDFMFMPSYEERAIARDDTVEPDGTPITVDTCLVTDSGEYIAETAVCREGGSFVVVQCYLSREEAEIMHGKWLRAATMGDIPKDIEDAGMSDIARLARLFKPTLPDGNVIDQE